MDQGQLRTQRESWKRSKKKTLVFFPLSVLFFSRCFFSIFVLILWTAFCAYSRFECVGLLFSIHFDAVFFSIYFSISSRLHFPILIIRLENDWYKIPSLWAVKEDGSIMNWFSSHHIHYTRRHFPFQWNEKQQEEFVSFIDRFDFYEWLKNLYNN